MDITFEQVKEAVKEYGSEVGTILPHQNWIHLNGAFTPAQLRIIAKEIEDKKDNINNGDPN